jgi:condensin complex subunit 2
MSGRFNEENLTDAAGDGEEPGGKHEHLGEMYREVIRMNAENKINASNSWSLRLIDNIDKFLEDEGSSNGQAVHKPSVGTGITTMGQDGRNESTVTNAAVNENDKRINFTKASCTIDASVKIYSYRVDDVYLSSYKVLANLNRSDGKTAPSPDSDRTSDDEDFIHPTSGEGTSERVPSQKKTKERHSIKTLEENVGTYTYTFIY